mmetsp:Transcript_13433/g.20123  ORF Transcript_13433/g.20123 Transcript_13433/m.20123 type:complete len:218 (-) Transcript_13433:1496-2149(-)
MIASLMVSIIFVSNIASVTVLISGLIVAAGPSRKLDPGSAPVAPFVFRETMQTLYFFLSPYIIIFEMIGQIFLMLDSSGTGATFSPPAPIISSLYLPVIFSMPDSLMHPLSPECIHPSLSIAPSFFFFMSATCSSPIFGLAIYPIIIERPRKQISPCSSSVASKMFLAGGHSFFTLISFSSTLNTFTSTPGTPKPQDPQRWHVGVEPVVPPVDSDIP